MIYAFNDFSEESAEKVEMIKYAERTKAQLKDLNHKQLIEAIADELSRIEEDENKKDYSVKDLEDTFVQASNDAFELVDRFNNGELRNWGTDDLKDELENYKGNKQKETIGRVALLYGLSKKYMELTGKKHLSYGRFKHFSWIVTSELEKELAGREKMQEEILAGSYDNERN